jgi:ArsR family transcriptional regulator
MKNLWVFDKNKILILEKLYHCYQESDICGCDLVEELEIPKNLLSYHIKILREKGFVEEEPCGKKKNYTISEAKLGQVKNILAAVELIKQND